jgi:hypothetical protein
MRFSRLVIALVLSVSACSPAPPRGLEVPPGTEVVLNKIDGSTASGRLVGMDGAQVVIRTAAGQELRIAYSEVASVRAILVAPSASKRGDKPAVGGRNPGAARGPAESPAPSASGYKDFQVSAGTHLSIELSTALASEINNLDDQVKGRLREAIVAQGVELVPAGSVILGTVTEAARALRDQERGRIAVRFSVIEHPNTGSRVSIKTAPLAFEAEATLKNAREAAQKAQPGGPPPPSSEVRVHPGTTISATLLAAFVVRIPVT